MALLRGRHLAVVVGSILACATSPGAALNAEPTPRPTPQPTSRPDSAGALLGRSMPRWQVSEWANTEPLELDQLHGKVVVVRFWTDTCPYCRASTPALQGLAYELAGQPVVFVGPHHQAPRPRPSLAGRPAGRPAVGVTFPLGHDADWATLRSWWLETGDRRATSATVVIGKDGKVTHVHPGPVYFPSDAPRDAAPNRDWVALREAVVGGLSDSTRNP